MKPGVNEDSVDRLHLETMGVHKRADSWALHLTNQIRTSGDKVHFKQAPQRTVVIVMPTQSKVDLFFLFS